MNLLQGWAVSVDASFNPFSSHRLSVYNGWAPWDLVKLFICDAVKGLIDIHSIRNTSSADPGMSVLGVSTGSWLRKSALVLVLNLIVYSYEASASGHHWIWPHAMGGSSLLSLNKLCSGLWSVLRVNMWPNKLCVEFSHQKLRLRPPFLTGWNCILQC